MLEHLNWELFDHPAYSPDFDPSDYRLCTYLSRLQSFFNNNELTKGVKTWLSSQMVDFFDTGT
jgi:hypothetical protein